MSLLLALALAAPPEWLGTAKAAPARIVSLAPSWTETLFAIGAGAKVVGVTRFDALPDEVRQLPKVGGFVDPEPEAVLALRPDLVVAASVPGARGRLDALVRLGVPVLVLPAESLDDLWQGLALLGELTSHTREAAALTTKLKQALTRTKAAAQALAPLRVLMVVGYRPLVAAGSGSFMDALLASTNGANVVTRGGAFPRLDLEVIAKAQPDVVLELTYEEEAPTDFWASFTRATGKTPRIVRLPNDNDALLRPGPRLDVALELLSRALRP